MVVREIVVWNGRCFAGSDGGEEAANIADQQVGFLVRCVVAAAVIEVLGGDVGVVALGVGPDRVDVVRELCEADRDSRRAGVRLLPLLLSVDPQRRARRAGQPVDRDVA